MELKDIRKELDKIDIRLVELLGKRQSFMKDVAEYKKENGLPIHQPEREAEILKTKAELAATLGLDMELVRKIFEAILESSKKIQEKSAPNPNATAQDPKANS